MFVGAAITPCRPMLTAPADPTLVLTLGLQTATLPSGLTFARASVATDIINGVLTSFASGAPRISVANGLLIEGSRTNDAQNSTRTVSGNDTWTGSNQTGPDGVANSAGTFTIGNATVAHFLSCNNFAHTATQRVVSCFVKPISGPTRIQLAGGSAVSTVRANFDLTGSGAVFITDATSAGIIALANGWYRIWMIYTATANTGAAAALFFIDSNTAVRAPSFTGNSTDAIAVYGMQSELGDCLSSYIATTAASVTRPADAVSMTGANFSSWYNASEGTIAAEYLMPFTATSANRGIFSVNDTTTANRIYSFVNTSSNATCVVTSGGVAIYSPAGNAATYGSVVRVAIGYKVDQMRAAYANTLLPASGVASVPVAPSRLVLGGNHAITGESVFGYLRALNAYNVRKPDATIQAYSA